MKDNKDLIFPDYEDAKKAWDKRIDYPDETREILELYFSNPGYKTDTIKKIRLDLFSNINALYRMTDLSITPQTVNIEQAFYCFKRQLDYIFSSILNYRTGMLNRWEDYIDSNQCREADKFLNCITRIMGILSTLEELREKYRGVLHQNYVRVQTEFMKEYDPWKRFESQNLKLVKNEDFIKNSENQDIEKIFNGACEAFAKLLANRINNDDHKGMKVMLADDIDTVEGLENYIEDIIRGWVWCEEWDD